MEETEKNNNNTWHVSPGVRWPTFKSWLCHILALELWTNALIPLENQFNHL